MYKKFAQVPTPEDLAALESAQAEPVKKALRALDKFFREITDAYSSSDLLEARRAEFLRQAESLGGDK